MKNAILVHGYVSKDKYYDASRPSMSNNQWFPWLTSQLMSRDIFTVSLEMPEPWRPDYAAWRRELERFDITDQTVLVGHSFGAGFLVRWLSENEAKVGKVVLVAPFMGLASGDDDEDRAYANKHFFDFDIDNQLAHKTSSLTIFKSTDDSEKVNDSIDLLMQQFGASCKLITLEGRGHFRATEKWTPFAFPELLREIINEEGSGDNESY